MKKVIAVIAVMAIAIVSGGVGLFYGMSKGSAEAKDAVQAKVVGTVQTDKSSFSCGVEGCTQTGEHSHGGNGGGHHGSGHGGGHH